MNVITTRRSRAVHGGPGKGLCKRGSGPDTVTRLSAALARERN
jgi:hypothetical protein